MRTCTVHSVAIVFPLPVLSRVNHYPIELAVCQHFQISSDNLISGKVQHIYTARVAFAWLLKKHLGFTCTRIGAILKRDHSTVVDMLLNAKNWADVYPWFNEAIASIESKIKRVN